MAGTPAATLSIEIIAEIARLQQDLDKAKRAVAAASGDIAASARAANDNLRGIGAGASGNVIQFSREVAKLKANMDPAWASLQRYKDQVRLLQQALREGAITHAQFVTQMRGAVADYKAASAAANVTALSIVKAGSSSKFASHHLQNLAFQANDLGIQMLMAAQSSAPLRMGLMALVQQGSQVAGIMSQANAGVGDLAKVAGGAALRFAPLLAVLGSFAGALKIVTDDINENSKVTVTWGDVMLGTFDAVKSYVSTEVGGAFKSLGIDIGEVWQWTADASKKWANFVIGTAVAVPSAIIEAWKHYPAAIAEILLYAANGAISIFETWINNFISGINMAIGLVKQVTGLNLGGLGNVSLGRLQNNFVGSFAKMGKETGKAFVGSYKDYIGQAIDFISPFAEARARERLAKDAKKAGKDAGKAAGKAMKDEWMKELAKQFDDAFKPERDQMKTLEAVWSDNEKLRDQIEALKREAQVLHLVGIEREKLLTLLEQEAEIRPILARIGELENEIRRTGNDGLKEEIKALEQKIDLIKQRNQLKIDNAERVDESNRQAEALERQNEALREMISLLQQIGGFSGILGSALGFLSGDYGAIGGKFGGLLNMITGTKTVDGKEIAVRFGDELKDIFGLNGQFAATMTSVLQAAGQGAAIGSVTDDLLDKLGIKSNNTGAQIGGAVGMAAFGPIGAIGGAILGGIVGGLFGKSTKWARADISSATDDPRYRSNSGKYEGAVNDAAKAVIDGLKSIADQLGGVAGEFASIAIGVRDGSWRVNVNGTSLKVGSGAKDFGEDSAAAIAYAIQTAVQRGAITGINQSVLNLLQASGDFEEQLSKAAELQNIFTEIAQAADPMGYELEQLAKKFVSINSLLSEAGATQEEVDQVAAYQAQQEAAIRAKYAAEAAAKQAAIDEKTAELLALQGKATEALNKARAAELSQMDATTAAIQKQIYIEQDAATKRALWIELLEAQGKAEAAKLAQRDEVMRATLDENKATQQRIWLLQDLSEAYDRESEDLRNTADEWKSLGDTLRGFRKELYSTSDGTLTYVQALTKLMQVGGLASTGDKTAIGNLPDAGRAFLDIAKNSARSMQDYQRSVALVAGYTDQAIAFSDSAEATAERELAAMEEMVGQFITLNETAQSVEQALEKLVAFNAASAGSAAAAAPSTPATNSALSQLPGSFEAMQERMLAMQMSNSDIARLLGLLTRQFGQVMSPDGTGLIIQTAPDTPIDTVSA